MKKYKLVWNNLGIIYFKFFDEKDWDIYEDFAKILHSLRVEISIEVSIEVLGENVWVPMELNWR